MEWAGLPPQVGKQVGLLNAQSEWAGIRRWAGECEGRFLGEWWDSKVSWELRGKARSASLLGVSVVVLQETWKL